MLARSKIFRPPKSENSTNESSTAETTLVDDPITTNPEDHGKTVELKIEDKIKLFQIFFRNHAANTEIPMNTWGK